MENYSIKPWQRVLAIGVLLGLLFGATVGFGSLSPNPDAGRYPGAEPVRDQPETLIGSQVTVWGRVVETDPVVLQTGESRGAPYKITLTGDTVSRAEVGNGIGAHGTLVEPRRMRVDRALITGSGERSYMLYISLTAGLWVLIRFLSGWRFTREGFTFRPRDRQHRQK